MYRPVILLGQACHHNPALVEHLRGLGIPILLTFPAADLLDENDAVYCGRPGLVGQRAAGIIVNKASHVLTFGARLDPGTIGFDTNAFAPKAVKIVYEIDQAEIDKLPHYGDRDNGGWMFYCCDLSDSIPPFPKYLVDEIHPAWLSWCKDLYRRFRPELDGTTARDGYVDPHAFLAALSDACQPDDMIAPCSSGVTAETFFQGFKVKAGQILRNVSTIGAMGADIPMAVGSCIASGRRTICVTGDGGFMLNSQDLEVVRRLNLPITFFVWNNGGYASIRTMQDNRFAGHHVGCDQASGLTLPALKGIAAAYGIDYLVMRTLSPTPYVNALDIAMKRSGPTIVEVIIDPAWVQYPRVSSTLRDGKYYPDGLENMTPHLPADELAELMAWGN